MKKQNSTSKKVNVKPKNKSTRRKKIQKRTTILGKPLHRYTPLGRYLSWRSSTNVIFRAMHYSSLSDRNLQAFRKSLTSKRVRRRFRVVTQPRLELTKKPPEVRMGKGRGVKISRTIAPLVPGQICFEVRSTGPRSRKRAISMFNKGGLKLPFRFKARNTDI